MSEYEQGTAPAETSTDELAAQNAALRAQLEAENAKLTQAVADAQKAVSGGHTDEDVRRLEHPEEFADEPAADPTPAATSAEPSESSTSSATEPLAPPPGG